MAIAGLNGGSGKVSSPRRFKLKYRPLKFRKLAAGNTFRRVIKTLPSGCIIFMR